MDQRWENPPGDYAPNVPSGYEPPAPPYRSSGGGGCGKTAIVLAIVGCLAVVSLVVCCGGLLYWFQSEMSSQIRFQLEDHPIVVEHLGEVTGFEMNIMASGAAEDEDTWVYEVEGSKGKGIVTVQHVTGADGVEEIVSAQLRLPSGETFELAPESAAGASAASPSLDE